MSKNIQIIPIILMILVCGLYVISFDSGLSEKQEVWGQFGDWFGGVLNPIIAAMAFSGMIWAYQAQIQANELAANQFKKQNADDRLFRMIDLHLAKIEAMSAGTVNESGEQRSGRTAIEYFLRHLKRICHNSILIIEKSKIRDLNIDDDYSGYVVEIFNEFSRRMPENLRGLAISDSKSALISQLEKIPASQREHFIEIVFANSDGKNLHEDLAAVAARAMSDEMILAHFKTSYDYLCDIFGNEIGHYFRNMCQILIAIEESNAETRDYFGKLFRAQLSRFEIALIAANCISNLTDANFNRLVVIFDLLKGLYQKDLPYGDRFDSILKAQNKELIVDAIKSSAYRGIRM